jgi:hypothetical protein
MLTVPAERVEEEAPIGDTLHMNDVPRLDQLADMSFGFGMFLYIYN